MARPRGWRICGVDFTSAPRPGKSITVAAGGLRRSTLHLDAIDEYAHWHEFEAWLRLPGPWIAGFDFPFGLPREAVEDLRWPEDWPALVRHCAAMGRDKFRAALDRYRESRPAGSRYAHRTTDLPARSHSPLKLVNPPVGLMFLEGAVRLLEAGVSMPGLHAGDPARLAFEAYPGYCARQVTQASYKNDARAKQTPARRQARKAIVETLADTGNAFGFALEAAPSLRRSLVDDATGDRLDAVLCAMQAAWAWRRRGRNYGLPKAVDPLEGWILMAPER
ncbi:MAG TPA: DUF429 domain-containing protein [Burkholderiales bacterium]|nr:DUF429 domain-containing protein [Burkholderiales bacterium]